ncbi:MAG: ABC-F family ATP-binding cassette domain-containing protein [Solirubrobacterales bacterium]
MNILTVENISKNYSEKPLLNNINFGIEDTDKIGVIGINGTGKSTLLKLLAGYEEPDNGRIIRGNSVRIEYLSQSPVFPKGAKISEIAGDYETQTILTKLGINDFEAIIDDLSGGQKKRIALARALANPSELLILDEPTNHLDSAAIDWLEQYLNRRKGALLMITHDRYFLDRVVNEIMEIDKGCVYTYRGNYSLYLEKKLERDEIESANEKKRKSLFKKELAWIRQGAQARSTKQKARIERFEKLKENSVDLTREKLELTMDTSRLGKKIIELQDISKSFHGIKYINNFTFTFQKCDRIGVVGANGTGKTTLINMICGSIKPDSGFLERGDTVKIGLFSQETDHMDGNIRVIDYIKDVSPVNAVKMLEQFLFPSELQWAPISKLSGGEKRRLYLLRVLAESPNVLLLDEPTNDLDIETLTILEDYLDEFSGVVLAVSHDRYFLDRIAEKIFVLENGNVIMHTGNYFDYIEEIKELAKHNLKPQGNSDKHIYEVKAKQPKEKPLKFTYKEQMEFNSIDDDISSLENKIQDISIEIEKAASDYDALKPLLKEKEILEESLEQKMERWVYLNDLAEKIENLKKQSGEI